MKITEIVFDVARISLVEFENGQNTLAAIINEKFAGSVSDATHWAGAMCGIVKLAVDTVPESKQVEFETRLMKEFLERVEKREETVVCGEVGEDLY